MVGFMPVLALLAALIWLDSYKLMSLRRVLLMILSGGLLAGICWWFNVRLLDWSDLDGSTYSRYVAPWIEDGAKAVALIWLLLRGRVGFLVDAAISGFAVGAGFALVENVAYFSVLAEAGVSVWIVRGFGTALMHGGVTAIFGVVAKALIDRSDGRSPLVFVPGLLLAVVVHSGFNHFFLSPVVSTMLIVLILPPVMMLIFNRSEVATDRWLDVGFDADTELLQLLHSGELSSSPVGQYLQTLTQRFRGEVVADLLCYLRVHTELALRAKGLLMMRESGFEVPLDEATRASFEELRYLERSIGRTGKLAMAPFLHFSDRELWQLYMLER